MHEIYIKFPIIRYKDGSYKIAISLPELVKETNAFSVKNRPGCVPSLIKSDPKSLFLQYNVKCNLKTSDPDGHTTKVRFDLNKVNAKTRATGLDVKVNCSCPAFLYWGAQWNTHQKDALEGEPRPKLQAPKERLDLRSNFLICKHCKAVCERILPAVQHNVDNILRKKEVEKNIKKGIPPNKFDKHLKELPSKEDLTELRKKQKERNEKNKTIQVKLLEAIKQRERELQDLKPEVKRTAPAVEENVKKEISKKKQEKEKLEGKLRIEKQKGQTRDKENIESSRALIKLLKNETEKLKKEDFSKIKLKKKKK